MSIEEIIALLSARPAAPLVPQTIYDPALSARILACECSDALKAGLLLWNDDLDASHRLSQQINTPTGSYWHAIMHRREPDYWNSKYWFHQTGRHPALAEVGRRASRLLDDVAWLHNSRYDPFAFVDACEAAAQGGSDTTALQAFQQLEIKVLIEYTRSEGRDA
ncbi:MAG: hypothetical protein RMN25_05130 [Anaerolineae bacterium]|nr:hypothetical protein [Thermoflexales bacterium]MDW8407148.1 hypothetical protein [Anaerolineae bacterium]